MSQFISFLAPTATITNYDGTRHASEQTAADIPQTFKDAMTVRERVFVEEQNIALENEFDADDARSFHWVVYASVGATGTTNGFKPGANGDSTSTTTTTTTAAGADAQEERRRSESAGVMTRKGLESGSCSPVSGSRSLALQCASCGRRKPEKSRFCCGWPPVHMVLFHGPSGKGWAQESKKKKSKSGRVSRRSRAVTGGGIQ